MSADDPPHQVPVLQRCASAVTGALMTSLLVTPLDVVKTRLQSQGEGSRISCCQDIHYSPARKCLITTSSAANICHIDRGFEGTWEGLVKIARYEGVGSLWRGLSPTLAMAIPANVIYFVGYENLRLHVPIHSPTLAPLLCGSIARILAVSCIAPIELFRTRLQGIKTAQHVNTSHFQLIASDLVNQVRRHGLRFLYRGLTPTLWRDVPFSGLYWFGVESIRSTLAHRRGGVFYEFQDSFVAGALSGLAASFLTHPFDLIKTRRQVNIETKRSTLQILVNLIKTEGFRKLWTGCVPRIAKVAPSCAIMLSTYEFSKTRLGK